MDYKTQFTVPLEDGSEYNYTVEITRASEFINILICDFNGYRELFECRSIDGQVHLFSLERIQQPNSDSIVYQKIESIAKEFMDSIAAETSAMDARVCPRQLRGQEENIPTEDVNWRNGNELRSDENSCFG
ncbi:hypothetical protein [Sphingobacterium bambusae]|uniref:Uncharacterized protein n=1 Tax=Sphingobacterium bambusae TaxID=662858 RepID=A0ABW6BJK3_9SPHI|nr:hypothetical protein [Sphingobacterium bambusae]WPL46679.1 hypothetical protein SCB77_11935 [Sphingobacterium bambusae]